ncbi:MAG TPA: hypothetical protein DEB06_06370 [Phycisphaerales bacterium]|nr:hypothetical protein [Phycisphaerales bacterium]
MNHLHHSPQDFEPTREDVLIGRVVDSEASGADWEALEAIASRDPGVWERLGRAQRVHARLEREVEDAIAIAELVDIPSAHAAGFSLAARVRQYSGWAVAAVIGVAFLGTMGVIKPGASGPAQLGGISPIAYGSPDEALQAYLRTGKEKGLVVEEIPSVLIDARVIDGGGRKEVVYVRQILERKIVTDLLVPSVEVDENGQRRLFERPVGTVTSPRSPEGPV